jgi:hypothetical protein
MQAAGLYALRTVVLSCYLQCLASSGGGLHWHVLLWDNVPWWPLARHEHGA